MPYIMFAMLQAPRGKKERPDFLTRGHPSFNPRTPCEKSDAECQWLRTGMCQYRHDCDSMATGGGAARPARSVPAPLPPESNDHPPLTLLVVCSNRYFTSESLMKLLRLAVEDVQQLEAGRFVITMKSMEQHAKLLEKGTMSVGRAPSQATLTFSLYDPTSPSSSATGDQDGGLEFDASQGYPVRMEVEGSNASAENVHVIQSAAHLTHLPQKVYGPPNLLICKSAADANVLLKEVAMELEGSTVHLSHPAFQVVLEGASMESGTSEEFCDMLTAAWQEDGAFKRAAEGEGSVIVSMANLQYYETLLMGKELTVVLDTFTVVPKFYPPDVLPAPPPMPTSTSPKVYKAKLINSPPLSGIKKFVIFQDGENCFIPKGAINATKLRNSVIDVALSCTEEGVTLERQNYFRSVSA